MLAEIIIENDASYGEAFFDLNIDVDFPCFALFLDSSQALLLRSLNEQLNHFRRIGIAKFLRTQSQRMALPMNVENITQRRILYGPITSQYPRSIVTIV